MNPEPDSNRSLWIILAIAVVLGTALCSAVILIGMSLASDGGVSWENLPSINFTPDILFNLITWLLFTLPLIFIIFTIGKRVRSAQDILQQKTGHSLTEIAQIMREQNFTDQNEAIAFLQTRFDLTQEDVNQAMFVGLNDTRRNRRLRHNSRSLYTQVMGENPTPNRKVGFVLFFVVIDLLICGGIAAFLFLSR